MVAVPYRRWSFTRGSNCKALTGRVLVFWIGGRLGRWLLTRSGRTLKFDCTHKLSRTGQYLEDENFT